MMLMKALYPSKLTLSLIVAWTLTILTITYGYSLWLEVQYNPNSTPKTKVFLSDTLAVETKQVTLKLNRYDHYISSGLINDQPVTFLFDTGSTHVAVPVDLADKLGLPQGSSMTTETANGHIEVYLTVIPSLTIGHIELKNITAAINPFMSSEDDILLGMSVLKHLHFSHKDGLLTLTQTDESKG